MQGIQERKTKNGETHYRAQVRLKGHPVVRATFRRKSDAIKWKHATESSIRENRFFKTAESRKHTLADAISRYERDILPSKPRAKQEQQLRWWKEQLGVYTLAEISPALIGEYRDKLAQSVTKYSRKMAPTTILRYLAALSHVLTTASREWGWIDETVMKKVSKPKQGLLRARFLSKDERERLLKACQESSNPLLYPIVVLGLATGMRRAEILNLTTDSIDLINQRIHLEHTKNGERRTIPLKGHALAVVTDVLQQKRQNIKFLFPSKAGSQAIDIRHPWEEALKRAGISNFKFHDLRHSCATALLESQASLAEISAILGHKSLSMIKRYAHLSQDHAANIVSKMNERIFG